MSYYMGHSFICSHSLPRAASRVPVSSVTVSYTCKVLNMPAQLLSHLHFLKTIFEAKPSSWDKTSLHWLLLLKPHIPFSRPAPPLRSFHLVAMGVRMPGLFSIIPLQLKLSKWLYRADFPKGQSCFGPTCQNKINST